MQNTTNMLLQPKNTKFRKDQKASRRTKGMQGGATGPSFGSYGLKTLDGGNIKAAQIEAVRRVIIRKIRKIGKIWIRTFPYKPISNKPTKTRMGKGKGNVQYWVCPIKTGQMLFEINGGLTKENAKEILMQAAQKLPVHTKFVERRA